MLQIRNSVDWVITVLLSKCQLYFDLDKMVQTNWFTFQGVGGKKLTGTSSGQER